MSSRNATLRVCLLTETYHPVIGGGENHARLLASHLEKRGVPVCVITRRSRRGLHAEELVDGMPVHRVPPSGWTRYGKYLMTLPAFMALVAKRASYDLIYVCGFRTLGAVAVVAGMLLRKAVILRAESEGEFSGQFLRDDRRLTGNPVLWGLARRGLGVRNALLRRADRFISISDRVTDELVQGGVRPSAIASIPNGVDLSRFGQVTLEQKRQLRQALGLSADRVIVSYSGKLNRYKGLELLLKVWEGLVRRHPQAYLLLIGSGEGQAISIEGQLKQFVRERRLDGDVGFTGFVADVHRYLQASDIYVFPSEREAFGLGPLEALACGVPVVATRVGAIPDIIDEEFNGLLIDVGDDQALERALRGLFEDRERVLRLGRNGPKAAARFHIERVIDAHLAAFQAFRRNGRHAAEPAEAH